jgi:hypothetical protein
MSILNNSQLIWLTKFLFLAIPAAAAQSAVPLPSDVAIPRRVRHKIVSNANHLTYKLMGFVAKVRLCRKAPSMVWQDNVLLRDSQASIASSKDMKAHIFTDGEVH